MVNSRQNSYVTVIQGCRLPRRKVVSSSGLLEPKLMILYSIIPLCYQEPAVNRESKPHGPVMSMTGWWGCTSSSLQIGKPCWLIPTRLCFFWYICFTYIYIYIYIYIYVCMINEMLVTQLCPTLATLRTVAHQAPLSMEFSRQQYWSG